MAVVDKGAKTQVLLARSRSQIKIIFCNSRKLLRVFSEISFVTIQQFG